MTETEEEAAEEQPTALLIAPGGTAKTERVLGRFLKMLLEYRYGLEVLEVADVRHVVRILKEHKSLHSVYLIQGSPVSTNSTVPILSGKGTLPLFLIQPERIAAEQRLQCAALEGVHVCSWEAAFASGDSCLAQTIALGLAGHLTESDADPEEQVRQRLQKLGSLPSLPTVLGRLLKLVKDPKSTMADLEVLLSSEPAIVLKIQQVASSAAVAGASAQGVGSLKDAITRLGNRKVGAIAQQIALINSMVRPDDSAFDLRKYWGHSLGCAIVADRIHNSKFVQLAEKVPSSDYWIAALLHDCGKAVQGFFFYEWFERITETMEDDECSFYEAEIKLGKGMVTHDRISEMVLQKAGMPEDLVEAVGLHHDPGDNPSPLVALIHVANGVCSEIGFGYDDASTVKYSRPALKALGLKRDSIREMVDALRDPATKEIMDVISQCLGD
ncbi:MAG: HDOD domain-containing protein [bacterium]|nr:HDOD domain-containing protein [bacterium]